MLNAADLQLVEMAELKGMARVIYFARTQCGDRCAICRWWRAVLLEDDQIALA